jgi:hypothetical protein
MAAVRTVAEAVEELEHLLDGGSLKELKDALDDFEAYGFQREVLINYPIPRYNGRTAVHLAASKGLFQCLKLFLKSGGESN